MHTQHSENISLKQTKIKLIKAKVSRLFKMHNAVDWLKFFFGLKTFKPVKKYILIISDSLLQSETEENKTKLV